MEHFALRDVVLVGLQKVEGVRATRTWWIFDEADGPGALGRPIRAPSESATARPPRRWAGPFGASAAG